MKKMNLFHKKNSAGSLCCLLAAVLALTSCLKDQEDYFERSASERLQDRVEQVKRVLRSAEHGWEFEYYPSSTLDYGGIVYTVRFDSLTATVSCSLVPDSTETTYYRLTNDNGPVLTFDTYNNLLHYFSTPNSGEYEAKGGEFEFVINEISDDQITLYGKKTRNTMYLRRLKASPTEYTERTIAIFDNFVKGFTGQVGTASVEGSFGHADKSLTVVSEGDTLVSHYTYNDKGIRLYQPLTLGGLTVQSFAYDKESLTFTCLDDGAEGVTLQGVPFDETKMAFRDYAGNYTLRYNDNTSTATVQLVPNRLNGTYRMTGLSSRWSLQLTYDYETGYLTLGPQVVGEYGGRTVYFVTYNPNSGSLWLTDLASFSLKWNGNRNRVAYNFTATNPSRYDCTSAVLVMIYYNEDGILTASLMSEMEWLVNGNAVLTNLNSLNKLRN